MIKQIVWAAMQRSYCVVISKDNGARTQAGTPASKQLATAPAGEQALQQREHLQGLLHRLAGQDLLAPLLHVALHLLLHLLCLQQPYALRTHFNMCSPVYLLDMHEHLQRAAPDSSRSAAVQHAQDSAAGLPANNKTDINRSTKLVPRSLCKRCLCDAVAHHVAAGKGVKRQRRVRRPPLPRCLC